MTKLLRAARNVVAFVAMAVDVALQYRAIARTPQSTLVPQSPGTGHQPQT